MMKPTPLQYLRCAAFLLSFSTLSMAEPVATRNPHATSQSPQSQEDHTLTHIRETFVTQFPEIPLNGVATTPFTGLYELQIDQDLVYTDAKVSFFIQGNLIDTQSFTNITEQRLQALNRVDFSSLPLDLAIKQGAGKHQIAVFEDPNCGYCKQLHQTLAQIDDITVYTFLFPILSEDSATKAQNIWCAPDRAHAWQAWMRRGEIPASAQCDTPISRVLNIGHTLRIRGTPTLFFVDGSRVGGALPLEALKEKLAQIKITAQSPS